MGRGGAGARDGDVRQGSHIAQGVTCLVELLGKLAVPYACIDCDGVLQRVDVEETFKAVQGDEVSRRVGYVVERMARAKYLQAGFAAY